MMERERETGMEGAADVAVTSKLPALLRSRLPEFTPPLPLLLHVIETTTTTFFSRPPSEGWPHHGRTFSIYPFPLSF